MTSRTPARIDRDTFALLLRRAGLDLPDPEIDDLLAGWSHLEPMLDRVRGAAPRGREAEPALVFRPDAYAEQAGAEEPR